MSGSPTSQGVVPPSKLPTRPATSPSASPMPRSVSDTSYASKYGLKHTANSSVSGPSTTVAGARASGKGLNGSVSLRRSASAKQISTTTEPTSTATSTATTSSTLPGIRAFRSRFLGGSIRRGSKIAAPAGPKVVIQAAEPPPLVTTISNHKSGDDSIKDAGLLSPQDSDFAPAKISNAGQPTNRPTSISGSSVGRKKGMFGFRRRTSMPAESISLPVQPTVSPRFQKQVSRRSIDNESKSATSLVNTRTSPAKVASISASTRLSAALSHDDEYMRDATSVLSSRYSTRSPVTIESKPWSPSKRDSSLRLASPSPVSLTPAKRGHSEASNVDEWVNAQQSIETPRQRPTSSRVSSRLEVERPQSRTSSLMRQGPPEGLSIHKDSLAPNKDDFAYRRHSISPVLGTFGFPQSSRRSFETRSTGAQSWSRSRQASPLPDEVADPVSASEPPASADTNAGAEDTDQAAVPSENVPETGSHVPPLVPFEHEAPSSEHRPLSQSTVVESRSSMDTFGEPRAQSVLPSPIPDGLRSSLLLDQTGLSKRFSAIEAARRNPAAAMRSVESGSPVLVKPEDGFSESPKSSRGPGMGLRAHVSTHEEEEEGKEAQYVETMSQSPTDGSDPEDLRGKRLSCRSHLASPLENLVFQLGGRRLSSDGGSLIGPTVNLIAQSIQVPHQGVIGGTSPSISIARSSSSSSGGHGLSGDDAAALASFPDPDGPLTLDQMEREIDRMEAELALTGGGAHSKRFATLGIDDSMLGPMDGATPPRGGMRKSVELAGVLGNSTTSPLTWPPPRTALSELERYSSQTSSNLSNDITPRTARRWSIVEVERAYERMKRILASASSKSMTAMSDSGTINESASELGDVAVEDAFETTLARARARAKENPVKAVLGSSDDDDDREELLLTPPPARARPFSSKQTTPTNRRSAFRDLKLSSPSAKALRESVARPGSLVLSPNRSGGVRQTARTNSSSTGGSLDDAALDDRPSRHHTVHKSSLTCRSSGDVFDATRNTLEGISVKRGSDTSRLAASTSSARPATIASTGTGTSEDGGWATPMSSLTFAQSGVSPRSNGVSRALSSPARSSLQQRSMDELGSRAAHVRTGTNDTTPKRRGVQIAVQARPSSVGSEPKSATGTWYPYTPNRHVHHREASLSSADERDSLNDTQRTLVDSSDLSMANVRGMDKLEIFFRYTSVKAELDKAAVERDALLDALGETRSTLMDVRAQRDALLEELKVEKAREGVQNNATSSASALVQLEQVRANWEARALDVAEELERAKQEVSAARQEIMDSRAREDTLEREVLALEEKVSAMEATQVTLAAGVTSLARRPGSNGTSPRVGSPRTGSVGFGGGGAPTRPPRRVSTDDLKSLGSPKLSSSPTKASPLGLPAAPSTPAPLFAQAYRIRASSAASSGNASDDSQGLVDATVTMLGGQGSSPLMEQRATFGPKSSFGSLAGTPLKSRSLGHSTQAASLSGLAVMDMTTEDPTSSPPQSQTMPKVRAKLRLPFPSFGVASPKSRLPSSRLVSKSSMASSATASDFGGDHLPPPSAEQREKAWDPKASQGSSSGSVGVGKLREDDERFLKDLLQEE